VRMLAERDADVVAYDPAATPNARRALDGSDARFAESAEEAIRAADVVVVATPWPEFASIPAAVYERDGRRRVVVDCWRMLSRAVLDDVVDYVALGKELPATTVAAN